MRRIASFIGLFLVLLSGGSASAQDIGLTPSDVAGLWININEAVQATAPLMDRSGELEAKLSALKPSRFDDKVPADVYDQVEVFQQTLDQVLIYFDLASSHRHDLQGVVTPSDVYLNSGSSLYDLAGLILQIGNEYQLVSQFYERHELTGLSPNDTFAQVDLANRRINLILKYLEGRGSEQ